MSFNFSQIRELISLESDITLHRRMFIFAGTKTWQKDSLKEILQGYESASLWVGESAPEKFPVISVKKAHSYLGNEKQVVIFDANENIDPDSFAAISGIVVGGGLFIVLMPAEENWHDVYSSYFGQRFIKSIQALTTINIIRQGEQNTIVNFDSSKHSQKQNYDAPFLSIDQQCAVETIEKEARSASNFPVVLISDRGRGKSAALGITAARLMQAGVKKIVITAPRLRAANVVFKHIKQLLPDAEIKRGKVILNNSVIEFYPPDQLQRDHENQESINADILLVDEAAAIPVPLLTSFLENFPQCIFATTVHGYEGTGRGFSVRFNNVLNEKKPGWKKLQMKVPIRWAENDPLEKWMFSLLCLDAEIVDKNTIGRVDNDQLEISIVEQEQLFKNESLLNEIFSLLVLAHYRTQPSDLQRLLDEAELSLYVAKYNHHVIAIALVNHEGKFAMDLSTAIYRGERRPQGHLLAQALTYHCGVEDAATLNYARVMRIVAHPELQGQGIGSKLLDFIIKQENKQGCDAIGTSFGMNTSLLNFWEQASFNVMRIGFRREQTSGEHAAIMLLPLSKKGEKIYHQAHERFYGQLPFWFNDVLRDLAKEIKQRFKLELSEQNLQLTDLDKQDLYSFINFSRNYELCIAAINKLVLLEQKAINTNHFPENMQAILMKKVMNKNDWKQISTDMNLSGKDAARKLFHQAIIQLHAISRDSFSHKRE